MLPLKTGTRRWWPLRLLLLLLSQPLTLAQAPAPQRLVCLLPIQAPVQIRPPLLPKSQQPMRPLALTAQASQQPSRRLTPAQDRKSTRLNSSHLCSSYAVFCLIKSRLSSRRCRARRRRRHDGGGSEELASG